MDKEGNQKSPHTGNLTDPQPHRLLVAETAAGDRGAGHPGLSHDLGHGGFVDDPVGITG
jgi:hypothetical protein